MENIIFSGLVLLNIFKIYSDSESFTYNLGTIMFQIDSFDISFVTALTFLKENFVIKWSIKRDNNFIGEILRKRKRSIYFISINEQLHTITQKRGKKLQSKNRKNR